MANPNPKLHPENLRPCKKGDPATKDKGRLGGKKSQEVQAQKRTMREWAVLIGNLPMRDGKITDPKTASQLDKNSPDKPNLTMDGAIIVAMYNRAAKGDTKAAMFLAKLKEQMADEITVKVDPLSELPAEDLIKLYEATRPKKA
jgi:hypothetical protein